MVRDALGMTCDHVYCWHLILEEYRSEIIYIKGVDNIVADATSLLEYYIDKKSEIYIIVSNVVFYLRCFCYTPKLSVGSYVVSMSTLT